MDGITVRDLHEKPVTIFNPDGSILVVTDNELTILDICVQIKEKKLEGYTIQTEEYDIIPIMKNGRIVGAGADTIGEIHSDLMRKLMGV